MKKFYSLMCMAAAMLFATTFTACTQHEDNPVADQPTEPEVLFEQSFTAMLQTNAAPYEPTEVTVDVKENEDHTFNVKVNNWTVSMYSGAYTLGFGTFELTNLEGVKDGDVYTVSGTQNAVITAGDKEGINFWYANSISGAAITVNAKFNVEKIYATLSVDATNQNGQNYKLYYGEEF